MGKKQHQKDKLYLTKSEWSELYGGYKESSHKGSKASFRKLPFDHCALSLLPFSHPYADPEGNVFDLEAILPFIKKFKLSPITGKPLMEKNLIKLKFYQNSAGEYHCPASFKTFTNNSYIVAIKSTGNVFAYEAVEELNIKPSNWRDLITDETFTKTDIMIIQNPDAPEKYNISSFYHIKKGLKVQDEEATKSKGDTVQLKNVSQDTKEILIAYQKEHKDIHQEKEEEKLADKFNSAHYSTGKVAAGFTSTVMDVITEHKPAILADDVVRYSRVKKKGYVSLKTNFGDLNLEIYCDAVPKTSENFIKLCERGYYNKTKLHRSIRHFMIQGGDPTSTGSGGESCWGGAFKDEFRPNLSHKGRGVLSMANSGSNTNKSQFFITFRSCAHLDKKHSIFGRVVGGLNTTLSAMEAVETDNKDRPIEDIVIMDAVIFVDPFKEVDEKLIEERNVEEAKRLAEEEELRSFKRPKISNDEKKVFRSGVGKFLDLGSASVSKEETLSLAPKSKKKKESSYVFKDFSVF